MTSQLRWLGYWAALFATDCMSARRQIEAAHENT
jgi:hypothetical protein